MTTEEYKNLLKDIVAISSGGKDSANNDQPGVDKHFWKLKYGVLFGALKHELTSGGKDEEAAATAARSIMDNIKQRGIFRRRKSTSDAGEVAMYVTSFGGDSRAAETEGAPSPNTQGTDGEEVPSGTAKPATNNSSSTPASKSTAVSEEAIMELLKAAVHATREKAEHGDAEEARVKEADQKAETKAEVEDKESSTTSSAVKLFEQLGINGQLSKEDLSRIIAQCQKQLSPGK